MRKLSAVIGCSAIVLLGVAPWAAVAVQYEPVRAIPVRLETRLHAATPAEPTHRVAELPIELDDVRVVTRRGVRRQLEKRIECWIHKDDSEIAACGYAGHPLNPRNAIDSSLVRWGRK